MNRLGASHPIRTLVLCLAALLAALTLAARAAAVSSADTLRLATVPFLPADVTVAEVPDAVLISTAPEMKAPLQAGHVDIAGRDFSAGGVTVAREFIMTSDDPTTAEGFLQGFGENQPTAPTRLDGVTIWKSIPSTNGTVAIDAVVAASGDSVVAMQISGELGLSQAQLGQVGQAMRARLASAVPAAATTAPRSPGSPVVSVLVIALALGLVVLIVRESRGVAAPAH